MMHDKVLGLIWQLWGSGKLPIIDNFGDMKLFTSRSFGLIHTVRNFIVLVLFVFGGTVQSQQLSSEIPLDWHLLDPESDQVQGLSVEKTYTTLLKNKPSKTVVVAVIDSGIDTEHEDLKSVMWINPGEVAGNGMDDDKNGYVDDIHGWSFIGSKAGNVNEDTYELTRELVRLSSKFEKIDTRSLSKKDKADFDYYTKVKSAYEEKMAQDDKQYKMYKRLYQSFRFGLDTLRSVLGKGPYTQQQIESVKSDDPAILFAKSVVINLMKNAPGTDPDQLLEEIQGAYEYFQRIVEYGLNKDFDPRSIVGDDYNNKKERLYGAADVKGPDAEHGTHVAGIIAADRTNELGIKGIADNVKIMAIRAVPNGDERDKDIANAIYYAVNNGARIINMSFGKDYSPDKILVDEAVRYAEKKGVLLIHAAGNDGKNTDVETNFPSPKMLSGKPVKTWIEIGASAPGKNETDLVADFSNFGKKRVDFFSPGVDIYSTIPNGGYKKNSGTSMAAPAASGVAALLMSYFPELSAQQVKDILVQSTRKFDGLKVNPPDGGDPVSLSELCITGGLVNAYEAVQLALKANEVATPKR
ncbi:MAG: S8 family peptidase [Cyclobacteriaceae bacterium]